MEIPNNRKSSNQGTHANVSHLNEPHYFERIVVHFRQLRLLSQRISQGIQAVITFCENVGSFIYHFFALVFMIGIPMTIVIAIIYLLSIL